MSKWFTARRRRYVLMSGDFLLWSGTRQWSKFIWEAEMVTLHRARALQAKYAGLTIFAVKPWKMWLHRLIGDPTNGIK